MDVTFSRCAKKGPLLAVFQKRAAFVKKKSKATRFTFDKAQFLLLMAFQISNIYVSCGNNFFRQVCGIPMGVDDGPLLANIFLMVCEFKWLFNQIFVKLNVSWIKRYLNHVSRYIDDLSAINSAGHFASVAKDIYPKELELDHENAGTPLACSFLSLALNIKDKRIVKTTYDKRNDFNFEVGKFTSSTSNVDSKKLHQLVHTIAHNAASENDNFADFLHRLSQELIRMIFKRNMKWSKLGSNLVKFFRKRTWLELKYGMKTKVMLRRIHQAVFNVESQG